MCEREGSSEREMERDGERKLTTGYFGSDIARANCSFRFHRYHERLHVLNMLFLSVAEEGQLTNPETGGSPFSVFVNVVLYTTHTHTHTSSDIQTSVYMYT